ncbi:MAG: PQQ-dependent sugar dehydrogenase [Planctomycetota bacterium]
MSLRPFSAALALAAALPSPSLAQDPVPVRLQYFTGGISRPTDVAAPLGDDRLFVTEQEFGRVRIVDAPGNVLPTPFVQLGGDFSHGGEQGLLGLAFHPNYTQNGYFFVTYTDGAGRLVLARYRRAAWSLQQADPSSLRILFKLDQPHEIHKGADLQFGPDGYLYMSVGDGGGSAEATCRAQDITTMHGKMLRIDVDKFDVTGTYAIPSDNPFVGVPGARGEILHLGLRNPWRFALDPLSGDLWIADVGESVWEEVDWADASERGVNFGWKVMEGPDCFTESAGCVGGTFPVCHDRRSASPLPLRSRRRLLDHRRRCLPRECDPGHAGHVPVRRLLLVEGLGRSRLRGRARRVPRPDGPAQGLDELRDAFGHRHRRSR